MCISPMLSSEPTAVVLTTNVAWKRPFLREHSICVCNRVTADIVMKHFDHGGTYARAYDARISYSVEDSGHQTTA